MSAKLYSVNKSRSARQKQGNQEALAGGKVFNFLYRKSRKRGPILSRREREKLVLEFRLKARKLARSILRKWHARLDLEEVDSVVDLSLCEAVRRYNPNVGATFMTFLYYHLRGNLIRAVSAAATANVVPCVDQEKAQTKDSKKRSRAGRSISAIEVAEALCSHEHLPPDEFLFKKEVQALSEKACSKLDRLEKEVIYRIYLKGQQLMDIANSLGYSRCHISRVKKKALEVLHEEMSASLERGASPEEGDDELNRLRMERRKIYRRKPRSKKAKASQAAAKSVSAAA